MKLVYNWLIKLTCDFITNIKRRYTKLILNACSLSGLKVAFLIIKWNNWFTGINTLYVYLYLVLLLL